MHLCVCWVRCISSATLITEQCLCVLPLKHAKLHSPVGPPGDFVCLFAAVGPKLQRRSRLYANFANKWINYSQLKMHTGHFICDAKGKSTTWIFIARPREKMHSSSAAGNWNFVMRRKSEFSRGTLEKNAKNFKVIAADSIPYLEKAMTLNVHKCTLGLLAE